MALRFTNNSMEFVGTGTAPNVRVTGVFGNVVTTAPRARMKVTHIHEHLLGKLDQSQNNRIFTGVYMNVLCHVTPKFEWNNDLFTRAVFPFDISFNSIGATKFVTDVVITDSGYDQRNNRWDQPLMEYDVAYGVRTMEHLHGLISFFRAMQGKKYAFLFHDVIDHTSTLAVQEETRAPPVPLHTDQSIGTGDGITQSFQLRKAYSATINNFSTRTLWRPIQKPKPANVFHGNSDVLVGLNGQPVTNFTVNYDTGVVSFTSSFVKAVANGAAISARDGGGHCVITSITSAFSQFAVGQRVVMYGWLNYQNNNSLALAQTFQISAIAGDGHTMTIAVPAGFGVAESGRNGVVIYVHPAPDSGVAITAGFHFWVPVRFDTDRLPASLEEYGVGGIADVKLVEVRPAEALP